MTNMQLHDEQVDKYDAEHAECGCWCREATRAGGSAEGGRMLMLNMLSIDMMNMQLHNEHTAEHDAKRAERGC